MRRRQRGLNFYRRRKKISSGFIKEFFSWAFGIFTAVFLAAVLVISFGVQTSMIGNSMEPELYNGQQVFINRFTYKLVSPKRGDVICFLPNGNQNSHYYVKRVVGLPGETIQIREGKVYIDGYLLDEDSSFDKMADAGIAATEITLESGEYFVLGDNRNYSEDSRSANIGAVSKDHIVGKAWFHLGNAQSGMGFVKSKN